MLGLIAGIGMGVANMISQNNANRRNEQFQREMYDRQRQDSLADWNMQNEYNSPEAQMRRLREAGLNPNLVYGNGSAANTASAPDATSNRNMNFEAINPAAIGEQINAFQNVMRYRKEMELLDAQIRNTDAKTNEVNIKSKADGYWNVLTMKYGTDADKAKLGMQLDKETWNDLKRTRENIADRLVQDINLKANQAQYISEKNDRERALNPTIIYMNLQRALTMKMQQSVTPYQKKYYAAQITKLMNDASTTEGKAGFKILGLDNSIYGQSKGMFYDMKEKMDKYIEEIDKNFKNKSKEEQMEIYRQLSQY